MSLEVYTGQTSALVATNPADTDPKSEGAAHMRGIKKTLLEGMITTNGAVNSNPANQVISGTLTVNALIFPAAAIANPDPNALDDYQEGTFTPTIAADSGGWTATATGFYTIIGNRCRVDMTFVITNATAPTGNITIGGLPVPALSTAAASVNAYGMAATMTTYLVPLVDVGSPTFNVFKFNGTGGIVACAPDIIIGTNIRISVDYRIA